MIWDSLMSRGMYGSRVTISTRSASRARIDLTARTKGFFGESLSARIRSMLYTTSAEVRGCRHGSGSPGGW